MRLIFHLSYDFGPKEHQRSVNYFMPNKLCSVSYRDLDHVTLNCLHLLEETGSGVIYFAKTDICSAFRLVPFKIGQFWLLIIKAEDPEQDGVFKYFADKCLPFGASISCALFQKVSDALCWIMEYRICKRRRITNYLNDFLFLAACRAICNYRVAAFLEICQEINCLVAQDKTVWASIRIIFLGILLDGEQAILVIPKNKRVKALHAVSWICGKKKVTIKQVQCVCHGPSQLSAQSHSSGQGLYQTYVLQTEID